MSDLNCTYCRELDRDWTIEPEARDDLVFRRKRRLMLHVIFCLTNEQRGEWLRGGGIRTISEAK